MNSWGVPRFGLFGFGLVVLGAGALVVSCRGSSSDLRLVRIPCNDQVEVTATQEDSIPLTSRQTVADVGMQISLPAGYSIAQTSTPLLAPGARAYGVATPHGLDPRLLIALWVYSPAAAGAATTTLQNALNEESGSVFSAAAARTPLLPRVLAGRKAWQRQLSGCPLNDVLQLLYIELTDGSIVRLAVDGSSDATSPSVQRSAFETMAESIAFDSAN